mgnify:CR=1 FL=1
MAQKINKGLYLIINLVAMAVIAVVLVLLTLKGLNSYTKQGEAVEVPNVEGLTVERAKAMFASSELFCEVSDSTYVKDKPKGVILDCVPPIGSKVKEGRLIYLTINRLAVPLVQIPDVADNSSSRQARARVLAAGFKLTEDEMIGGERDWVYAVKYNGRELEVGEKVPSESLLTLVVGDGSEVINKDSLSSDEWVEESAPLQEDSWFE